MDLNQIKILVEIDGYRIEIEKTSVCLACFLDGGENADMGPTINEDDKMIHIDNIEIVPWVECDYVNDHIQGALDTLVARGDIIAVGDGKYRAI